MLSIILQENSFDFSGENYRQVHGTATGTKMAVSFANIFMAEMLSHSKVKLTVWKRFINDVFSLWEVNK